MQQDPLTFSREWDGDGVAARPWPGSRWRGSRALAERRRQLDRAALGGEGDAVVEPSQKGLLADCRNGRA